MPEPAPGPQIVEAYQNYSPHFDAVKTVRLLLRYVPPQYLAGLRTIVLTNHQALSHDRRRQKLKSRGKKIPMNRVRGTYHQAWKGNPAWIRIFVDQTMQNLPAGRWIPILRTLNMADVLYHEIGHHIHKTSRPEFREREDVADAWKNKLERNLARSRYWFLAPLAFVYRLFTKKKKSGPPRDRQSPS
jgi:hypothetical protein